jgi:hypothetical protein
MISVRNVGSNGEVDFDWVESNGTLSKNADGSHAAFTASYFKQYTVVSGAKTLEAHEAMPSEEFVQFCAAKLSSHKLTNDVSIQKNERKPLREKEPIEGVLTSFFKVLRTRFQDAHLSDVKADIPSKTDVVCTPNRAIHMLGLYTSVPDQDFPAVPGTYNFLVAAKIKKKIPVLVLGAVPLTPANLSALFKEKRRVDAVLEHLLVREESRALGGEQKKPDPSRVVKRKAEPDGGNKMRAKKVKKSPSLEPVPLELPLLSEEEDEEEEDDKSPFRSVRSRFLDSRLAFYVPAAHSRDKAFKTLEMAQRVRNYFVMHVSKNARRRGTFFIKRGDEWITAMVQAASVEDAEAIARAGFEVS